MAKRSSIEILMTKEYLQKALDKYQEENIYKQALNRGEYDWGKNNEHPVHRSIEIIHDKTWEKILMALKFELPIDSWSYKYLSHSLHHLTKMLQRILGANWKEVPFVIENKNQEKILKPDGYFMEISGNNGIPTRLMIEVKLSPFSSYNSIKKYLQLIKSNPDGYLKIPDIDMEKEGLFFGEISNSNQVHELLLSKMHKETLFHPDKNNILYICYLNGFAKKEVILPGESIASLFDAKTPHADAQPLPRGTEIQFIHFSQLPSLFQLISQIKPTPLQQDYVHNILKASQIIQEIINKKSGNQQILCKKINNCVKYAAKTGNPKALEILNQVDTSPSPSNRRSSILVNRQLEFW